MLLSNVLTAQCTGALLRKFLLRCMWTPLPLESHMCGSITGHRRSNSCSVTVAPY